MSKGIPLWDRALMPIGTESPHLVEVTWKDQESSFRRRKKFDKKSDGKAEDFDCSKPNVRQGTKIIVISLALQLSFAISIDPLLYERYSADFLFPLTSVFLGVARSRAWLDVEC